MNACTGSSSAPARPGRPEVESTVPAAKISSRLRDIARLDGVSEATCSRALAQGRSFGTSPRTRVLILGHVPHFPTNPLASACTSPTGAHRAFELTGARVVLLGLHHVGGAWVRPDTRGGGVALGRHLAELGHRAIDVSFGPDSFKASRHCLDGGSPWPEACIRPRSTCRRRKGGQLGWNGGGRTAESLLADGPCIRAFVAIKDVAINTLAWLRRRRLRVLGQIHLCGLEGSPIPRSVEFVLTVVWVAMPDLGWLAVEGAVQTKTNALSYCEGWGATEFVRGTSTAVPL